MNDMIVSDPERGRRHSASDGRLASARTWALLGWVGLAFVVVGGVDFVLVWYPTAFGNQEWEFASVTQSFNGLPILVLGIALLGAAGWETEESWKAVSALALASGLLLCVVGGFLLWARSVPLALAAVPAEFEDGVQKAVVRTSVQLVAYASVILYIIVRSLRGTGR